MDFVILAITVVVALKYLILLMEPLEMFVRWVDSVNMDLKQNLIVHLERITFKQKERLSKIV